MEKKDVNKYRKASFTENGRPNLEWGTLLQGGIKWN